MVKKFLDRCIRILLVADPQILGNHELRIAQFDSDRNLRKSFYSAFLTVQPDYVIFLGDLMDEGSYANDVEFGNYFSRFMRIFQMPKNVIPIFLSGDNDIGGEGFEPVKKEMITRFKRYFGNTTQWSDQHLNFYNMNLISKDIPQPQLSNSNFTITKTARQTSVVLSHYEVISNYRSGKLLRQILPPVVIFSAHNHESMEILSRLENHLNNYPSPLVNGKIYNMTAFELAKVYLEIEVPTCSYRMGTMTLGYGQAIFDGDLLRYTPMFFISRFYQFGIYVIFLIIMIICNLVFYFKSSSRKKNLKYERIISNEL